MPTASSPDNFSDYIIGILKKHWLFEQRNTAELATIAQSLTHQAYQTDQYLFHEHDNSKRLYIVLSGTVSIETTSIDGRTTVLANLSEGEILGEFAPLDEKSRSASARFTSKCKIASMSANRFLDLLDTYPDMGVKLASTLVARLRQTNQKLQSIYTETLPHRLISLLIQLGQNKDKTHANKSNTNKSGMINIKLTQSELAVRLSASREKVNRHLHTLQSRKLVKLRRGSFDILDVEGLKTLIQFQ